MSSPNTLGTIKLLSAQRARAVSPVPNPYKSVPNLLRCGVMDLKLFSSKRKLNNATTSGDQLHPGEWKGGKKSRSVSPSRSPPTSGVSTSGTSSPNHPIQPSQAPGDLSPTENTSQPPGHSSSTGTGMTLLDPSQNLSDSTAAAKPTASIQKPSTAWTGLEQALQALRLTTKACPPLHSAIDDLVSCLSIFEAAAKNRKDYEDLAAGLKDMVGMLAQHLVDAASEGVTNALTGIAEAIIREVKSIDKRQSRDGLRRMFGSTSDDEDLIRRYRRIEQLFRQLYGEANLSAWNISSKHYVNTQLEGLHPAKLARYNSKLSMEVSRRACTENTRTKILENLMKWSEDQHVANIYWMNGMAGTGKTTIAYSASVALESSKQLAASFFCTRTSPECRDAKQIVPTIAYQFARRSAPFRSALCKVLEEDMDIGTGTISAQFDQLLKKPLMEVRGNMPNNLVVVVDALDECSDPYIVELFLGVLFRSVVDLPIKFFVTSRPEPMIRRRMISESERSRSILYLHEIEQSLVQADIELYLQEELASMQPATNDIKRLAKQAGKLFIYAATAVRYIRPPGRAVNSSERLRTILAANTESNRSLEPIDKLYTVILTTAIEDEALEPKEQDCILHILWTIVAAREPVLINTIAAISGVGCKDNVVAALEPLRSVLYVSEHNELVSTLHASFPDYILSQERSGRFACNIPKHSYLLFTQCFKIMKTQLRFNICNIKSSFVPDNEVPNLQNQINTSISEELFYACRFWMDHLGSVVTSGPQSLVEVSSPLLATLNKFLLQRLLFWMEVINLKKCMHIGIVATSKLNAWLSRKADSQPKLCELASNAHLFVIGYASRPISNYTPHIYISALPFAPFLSHYLTRFKGLIKISGTALNKVHQGALSTWEFESTVLSTAFSPTGDRMVLGKHNGELSVQNIHDGKHVFQPFKAHLQPIASIEISHDGTQIVTGSHDMTFSVWNAHNGSLISGPFSGHTNQVTSPCFCKVTPHL